MSIQEVPSDGQLVKVRQRRFVVLKVQASELPPDPLLPLAEQRPQHLVELQSVEDDGLGEELKVVWEIEPGANIYERATLPEPKGFDEPRLLDTFLHSVRWGAMASADVQALHAPFRAGITIEDYQLDPVVRALQMPRVNLLIADDVGLGKTIEAGLTMQELLLRHRARTVLVICPAALQIHWRDQMRDKFGLEFRIVDSDLFKHLRRRRGIHVNPWTHFPRLITSMDFIKRDRPMRLFRETLPPPNEPAFPRRYDLLIVDEAHNVAPAGRGLYAIASQRTEAIRTLKPHFEHRLFITATPHNGYTESFTALLELVDDQRFHRGVSPDPRQVEAVTVRRLKNELPPRWDGKPRFPRRALKHIEAPYTQEERRIYRALNEYTALRRKRATDEGEVFATEFVMKLLKKRLISSPEAFRSTLEQHLTSLKTVRKEGATRERAKPKLGLLRQRLSGIEEEHDNDESYEEATQDLVDVSTRMANSLSKEEDSLVKEMRTWADRASAKPDSKAKELLAWLRVTLCPKGKWNDLRVIIFTEYRATQKWLQGILAAAKLTEGERVLILYGGMPTKDRERIKAAFQAAPTIAPVRILLATDAASEGIDLQNHCSRLIHYEIPWNPMRMEQRNGRVDRHGQKDDPVQVFHFVGKGFKDGMSGTWAKPGDLEGDLEFLYRTAAKVDQIREDLGKVGPVIAEQVEEAMLGNRARLDTNKAEEDAKRARRFLKFERKIREDIERHYQRLRESRDTLNLTPEHVREVVELGLRLAGQLPLKEAKVHGLWPSKEREHCPVFEVPVLTGSWAPCAFGLGHPHTGERRPIVFDESLAAGRDDVVLAHLNHRLVQMCLRLLRAEIWAPEGKRALHRVTARLVPKNALARPVAVAHGRLVVLGSDKTRLHEEIISAGIELGDGKITRLGVTGTASALKAQLDTTAPLKLRKTLAELWPKHRRQLLQAIERRMKERTEGLMKKLAERGEKEAANIEAILKELAASIEQELAKEHDPQLEMFKEERDQSERDKDSMRARLREIPAEIEREASALRRRYQRPEPRLFPVAVTYLVPEHLAKG